MHIDGCYKNFEKTSFFKSFVSVNFIREDMRTKLILGVILSICYCITIDAAEEDLPLYNSSEKEWNEIDNRSLSIVLRATYDENTICVYSDIATSNATIVIKDKANNIVYSNTNAAFSRCHTFYISDLLQGDYLLVIKIEDNSFYGNFSKEGR